MMKIALVYLRVSNIGDLIIYETARKMIEEIVAKRKEHIELVEVSIGSYEWKKSAFNTGKKKMLPLAKKIENLYKRLLRSRKLYKHFPKQIEKRLRAQWMLTPAARYYFANEREKLYDVDMIIFCGGGLFKYHQQNFHYFLDDITRIANERKIPIIFNAVGIEGYSEGDPECMLLKKAVNRSCVKYISTRDDFKMLINNYTRNTKIVRKKTCDPAFWTKETYQVEWVGKDSGLIGLNVIRPNIFKDYMYQVSKKALYALYNELIQKLISEGYRVELFCNGVDQDAIFVDNLLKAYPALSDLENLSVFKPTGTFELVDRIAHYERFMAVRLHASIVGTVLGIPNVSLVWNKKQILFGKQVKMPQNYITKRGFNAENICSKLLAAEPYVMDEKYKLTDYAFLESGIVGCIKSRKKALLQASKPVKEKELSLLRRMINHPKNYAKVVKQKVQHNIDRIVNEKKRKVIRNNTNVNNNEIVFMTNTFTYTCNPKYIDQEIRRRNLPYHITWVIDNKYRKKDYPKGTDFVRIYSEPCTKAVYSAKVWIDNGIAFSNYFDKKPEQIHIQTMHGSLGIKRIDNAVLSRNARGKRGRQVVRRETLNTNYVITNSAFEESVFRRVFWKDTPMIRLGHARTDVLFSEDEGLKSTIRNTLQSRYGIPVDKKLVLYAPTHRKGMTVEDTITDYVKLNEACEERFGGKYVTLVRLHSRTRDISPDVKGLDYVFDVTDYPDIQELMLVADVGITDYSSWIFDYVNTRKPGFLYATDQGSYENYTGLAYPLTESPFPVSSTFEMLLQQIGSFDSSEDYQDKITSFLKEKQAVDDGHSAARIVDWLEGILAE